MSPAEVKELQLAPLPLNLLGHLFELRAEHSSVVPIKCDMEPVPFLAFDDKLRFRWIVRIN
jgi:hypothetical protein